MTEFKINQAIRANGKTYLPGMEDGLANLLTDEQFERLMKSGHLGEPDVPKTQKLRPSVSGNTSTQAELEAAAIKAAMEADEAAHAASKLDGLRQHVSNSLAHVTISDTRESDAAAHVAKAKSDADAKRKSDAKRTAAHRAKVKAEKDAAKAKAAQPTGELAAQLAGEQELIG